MDIDDINIRRLDPTLLLVFAALVRQRKTTEVGRRLGLSQSAVSHALARLRDLFGDRLFLRRPDGLEPTARALALLPAVEDVLLRTRALLSGGGFDPATTERSFRIAANDFVTAAFGLPLVDMLRREAPRARVAFVFAVGRDAEALLRREDADLALGRFYDRPRDLAATPFSVEPFVVAGRRGHPAFAGGLTIDGYCAAGHVLVSFRGGFAGAADEALSRIGRSRQVVASLPLFSAALDLVAAGDLVATVPERLARPVAQRLGIELAPVPFALDAFPLTLVRRGGSRDDQAVDWLAGQLLALAGPAGDPLT